MLVSGSHAYTGATLLAAEAALRAGCGMVYVAVPEAIQSVIQGAFREAVVVPLPDTANGTIAESALEVLGPYVSRADTVVIGPGLGSDEETTRFVHAFVAGCQKPLVLDADAINALEGRTDLVKKLDRSTIMTPHSGELRRLVGEEISTQPVARVEQTREVAKSLGVTLVHKGAPTMIASPEGDVWVNHHGSSALATGGTGDVLTGIVAGLRAQGLGALHAAEIACVIHGLAGERAARRMGHRSVIAGDLLSELGPAFLELEALRAESNGH